MALGFYIVVFLNEADAPGIIPSNWLCSDGNECFYPKARSNESRDKLIRLRAEPQESWDTHRIRIIGTFETYDSARVSLPVAEITSDLERHPEDKRRREKRILTLPGEDKSDDEDRPPVVKKTKKTVCKTKHLNYTNNFSQNMLSFNASPPRPLQDTTSRQLNKFNFNSSISKHAHNISPSTSHTPKVNSHNGERLEFLCQMIEAVSKKLVDMTNQMEDMSNQMVQMENKIISTMDLKLDQMWRNKENSNNDSQEKDFSEILPLRSMEDFNQLEQLLQEDPSLRKKMVKFLSLCGGRDIQKSVNNIMARLMVDELAICYNLTGKSTKGLTKLPFVGTRHFQVVLQTCQNVLKGTMIEKVKECVSNWFHQSKTRISRRAPAVQDERIEQTSMDEHLFADEL